MLDDIIIEYSFVWASDYCTDESPFFRRLVWAVDVGTTDSFALLI